jgi:ferredoxin
MTDKVYSEEEWGKALEAAKEHYTKVYVPHKEGDFHVFRDLKEGAKPDFKYQNTRLSAKGLVYPQSMRMFECKMDPAAEDAYILKEAEKDYGPRAVVGIRPCDAAAFPLIGRNFDNPEYRDPWWVRWYEATTFVGVGCTKPYSTCFCTSVGGSPFGEKGLDVLLYEVEGGYVARCLSEKGEKFLSNVGGGRKAERDDLKAAEAVAEAAVKKIVSSIETDKLAEKEQLDLFDAPFWEEVGFSCLNCGTCTYLCPTCWCFDIQDEVHGTGGERIRNWDSCMFPLFTLHGSGHNPRSEKWQRVRQRFMHKLKYFVDKYGDGVQCTGCGRCVRYCPVNIDIRRVAKLMNEY